MSEIKKEETQTKKRRKRKFTLFSRDGVLVAISILLLTSMIWNALFEVSIMIRPKPHLAMLMGMPTPSPTPLAEPSVDELVEIVTPDQGYDIEIEWGDIGKDLLESGAIDLVKYQENYSQPHYQELLNYLTESQNQGITINQANAYYWVNTLWALGLVQKSDVLEKGIMGVEYADSLGNFAATGGWTLGSKEATELFSSTEILDLDEIENQRVKQLTETMYRPCCANHTAFPDCNHGMALLGLVQIMVDQGFSDEEIYQASLAMNSYWFTQTYLDLAYYFQTEKNQSWDQVDPQIALSAAYSSGPGYQRIKEQMNPVPGFNQGGGGCGA